MTVAGGRRGPEATMHEVPCGPSSMTDPLPVISRRWPRRSQAAPLEVAVGTRCSLAKLAPNERAHSSDPAAGSRSSTGRFSHGGRFRIRLCASPVPVERRGKVVGCPMAPQQHKCWWFAARLEKVAQTASYTPMYLGDTPSLVVKRHRLLDGQDASSSTRYPAVCTGAR
jgi:hypothetical protein